MFVVRTVACGLLLCFAARGCLVFVVSCLLSVARCSLFLFRSLFVCLSAGLFVCKFVCLFVCLSVCLVGWLLVCFCVLLCACCGFCS